MGPDQPCDLCGEYYANALLSRGSFLFNGFGVKLVCVQIVQNIFFVKDKLYAP